MAVILWAMGIVAGCVRAETRPPSTEVGPSAESYELRGEARVRAQAHLREQSEPIMEYECIENEDCVATHFNDCCRNNAGESDCSLNATRADRLPERILDCGIQECLDGASFCPTDVSTSDVRCMITKIGALVEGTCQLNEP